MNPAAALRREERAGQDAAAVRRSTAACRKPKLYLASHRRPDGAILTFDAFGRTVAQRYPTTEPKAADSVNGQPNTVPDGEPATTTEYDVLDRVVKTTLPDTSVTTLGYRLAPDRTGTTQFETRIQDANVSAQKSGTDSKIRDRFIFPPTPDTLSA